MWTSRIYSTVFNAPPGEDSNRKASRLKVTVPGFLRAKYALLLFVPAICFSFFLWGVTPAEAATGYAGAFLRLGASARAMAMGDAFVALAEDATGGYFNPGGIARVKSNQVLLQHSERFAGVVNNDFLAAVIPGKTGDSYAISLFRNGIDDIKYTKSESPADSLNLRPYVSKVVSAADWALYLSYGRQIRPRLSVGSSLKLILRRLGRNTAFGYGVDLGILYTPLSIVSVGANLSDLFSTPINWDTGAQDVIMPSARTGIAFTWPSALLRGSLVSTFELRAEKETADYEVSFSSGAEYRFREFLALRLGSLQGDLTAGAGLRIYNRFDIDCAFLRQEENSYRVSLTAQL